MSFISNSSRTILVGIFVLSGILALGQGTGTLVPVDKAREANDTAYLRWRELDAALANLPKDQEKAIALIEQASTARVKVGETRQVYLKALADRVSKEKSTGPAVRLSQDAILKQYS